MSADLAIMRPLHMGSVRGGVTHRRGSRPDMTMPPMPVLACRQVARSGSSRVAEAWQEMQALAQ